MKRFVNRVFPMLFVFVLLTSMSALPDSGGEEAVVMIDGKKVEPEGLLKFDRDDTVYLEASGIKPNSMIEIKIKKAGIRWIKHEFEIDETGGVKGIMHMPETKITVTCFVKYYSADGKLHDIKFKFKTV